MILLFNKLSSTRELSIGEKIAPVLFLFLGDDQQVLVSYSWDTRWKSKFLQWEYVLLECNIGKRTSSLSSEKWRRTHTLWKENIPQTKGNRMRKRTSIYIHMSFSGNANLSVVFLKMMQTIVGINQSAVNALSSSLKSSIFLLQQFSQMIHSSSNMSPYYLITRVSHELSWLLLLCNIFLTIFPLQRILGLDDEKSKPSWRQILF